jgi:hypothetical protein
MSLNPTLSPSMSSKDISFNLPLLAGFLSGVMLVTGAAVFYCCRRFRGCWEFFMSPGHEPLLSAQAAEATQPPSINSNFAPAIIPLATHRAEVNSVRAAAVSDPQERARNAGSLLGMRIT